MGPSMSNNRQLAVQIVAHRCDRWLTRSFEGFGGTVGWADCNTFAGLTDGMTRAPGLDVLIDSSILMLNEGNSRGDMIFGFFCLFVHGH